MGARVLVTVRVPVDLLAEVDRAAEGTDRTRTDVIVAALRAAVAAGHPHHARPAAAVRRPQVPGRIVRGR